MIKSEFDNCLARLRLSQTEAAHLLSVSPRTVRRWAEDPKEIPGPAEQALRAWMRLDRLGLSWRPDAIALGEKNPDTLAQQIAIHRHHTLDLGALIRRVAARGGPAAPWIVDLRKCHATLGKMEISFYPLLDGTFSPMSYSRYDREPDAERDRQLIEDGFAMVAQEIAKAGPNWAIDRMDVNLEVIWQEPTYNSRLDTLRVPALDGQQSITCSIQRAALEKLVDIKSLSPDEMIKAFEKHRDRIIRAFKGKYMDVGADGEERVMLTLSDPV